MDETASQTARTVELAGTHGFITLVTGVPCFSPFLSVYLVYGRKTCSRRSKYHPSNQDQMNPTYERKVDSIKLR